MKKLVLLLTAVAVLTAIPLRAADISVGATTWYSWWDMKDSTATIDPGILYGPALSVKFNEDFNLNFVFLYGTYDTEDDDGSGGTLSYTYKRYDSDTSIGYRLNNYFKIFAGVKYNAYTTSVMGIDMKVDMYGPAAGISAVFPIGNDFFILANGSGMYLTGKSTTTGSPDSDFKGYGYNTAASLAYYIAPASVTLAIGGRYQYFKLTWDDSSSPDTKMDFYGFTAAATYSFSI